MKQSIKPALLAAIASSLVLMPIARPPALGQWGPMPTPSPAAQANARNSVRSQVTWLQNATRNATSYSGDKVGMVYQNFNALRTAYSAFTMTLNSDQASNGANELAELSAGLDIIEEAFTNYQNDINDGRSATAAIHDLCQILNQAAGVWLQQFNTNCRSLRIGY